MILASSKLSTLTFYESFTAAGGASDTRTADSSVGRRICSHARMLREDAWKLGADEDLVRAEEDDGAVRRKAKIPSRRRPCVVLNKAEVPELLRQTADDTLTGRQRSHPDRNPSQRH